MIKQSKNRTKHVRLEHGMFWIFLAVLLAVVSAGLILRVVQPIAPNISVESPILYSEGDDVYVPGTERQFVIIEVAVQNPTTEPFNFAPVLQVFLTDEQGTRYDMAPAELGNPIAAGMIEPGETRRGQLSFNVPKSVSALTFHFETTDEYELSYTHRL